MLPVVKNSYKVDILHFKFYSLKMYCVRLLFDLEMLESVNYVTRVLNLSHRICLL